MKKTLLTGILFSFVHTLFSQEAALLRNFKFRNADYRAISLSTDTYTQFANSDQPYSQSKNRAFSGTLYGNYYNARSTDRVLLTLSTNLSIAGATSKTETNGNESKQGGYTFSPGINLTNKWFSKTWFTELGVDANAYLSGAKNNSVNQSTEWKQFEKSGQVYVTLGIGKGRLEQIMDMQNALWLNRTLRQEERLTRALTDEELNGLGRAVTAANNTRILDYRRRTQFILQTVDNYLQSKGLINKTDIRYFTNLNDILFFAFNNPRLCGTEKFIRVTPGIGYESGDGEQKPMVSEFDEKNTSKSVKLTTGLARHIPSGLHHQNNYGASVQLFYLASNYENTITSPGSITEIKFDNEYRHAAINLFYEHAIYPNTRSQVSMKLASQAGYQGFYGSSFFGMVNVSGSWNYFISYRTRFTCGVNAYYKNNTYEIANSIILLPRIIQVYLNTGLQVSL